MIHGHHTIPRGIIKGRRREIASLERGKEVEWGCIVDELYNQDLFSEHAA